MTLLIAQGRLMQDELAGHVAVVTGAGGGIGYEAARALLWLGSRVVIAEIDRQKGEAAARRLNAEAGANHALFVQTDVGDERSVSRMAGKAARAFGVVDIVINNATVAPLGAVKDLPIGDWDVSYRVNLRGPVLMARAFLPGMLAKGWGVFACVSSVGQAYMAAYESLKAAQVHMGATLDAELEGTGVVAFTIGPGFVPTDTATDSIPRLAALMGQPIEELRALLVAHTIPVEAAGAGFAAAVVLAERYRGQEISSVQALMDASIPIPEAEADETSALRPVGRSSTSPPPPDEVPQMSWAAGIPIPEAEAAATTTLRPVGRSSTSPPPPDELLQTLAELVHRVRTTLAEQAAGWQERNIFERQWMIRTFRSDAKMPVEAWLTVLGELERAAEAGDRDAFRALSAPMDALARFFRHQYDLAKGYVRDPLEREKTLGIVQGWLDDVERLNDLIQQVRAEV
jgi:NAD(P)-dependent dehydrogenase (short-subunit alcohol dehydrogenase family)